MEETRINVCPQIRYHISYDENLTFKDLEDLLHLIRISNNDALQQMGISRTKGNDLQRIEKVEPGSIEIIIEAIKDIAEVVNDAATIISAIGFVHKSVKVILDKIRERRERSIRNPREDRKVYDKYELIVKLEERPSASNDSVTVHIIHIHICNS